MSTGPQKAKKPGCLLWFMPIQPIGVKNRKGSLGSYYAIQDYTAVNPEFGTLADFRHIVDKAHGMVYYIQRRGAPGAPFDFHPPRRKGKWTHANR